MNVKVLQLINHHQNTINHNFHVHIGTQIVVNTYNVIWMTIVSIVYIYTSENHAQ